MIPSNFSFFLGWLKYTLCIRDYDPNPILKTWILLPSLKIPEIKIWIDLCAWYLKCEHSDFLYMCYPHIIQSNIQFRSATMTQITVLIHISSIKYWQEQGSAYCKVWKKIFWNLILLLITFKTHDTRVCWDRYRVLIGLFYNKHMKVYTLPIFWEAVMLTNFL